MSVVVLQQGLSILPRKGMAVVWYDLQLNRIHEGDFGEFAMVGSCPVRKGEKLVS